MKNILLATAFVRTLFTAIEPAFGQSWVLNSAPVSGPLVLACSADGSKLVAAVYAGPIYTSTNRGATWTLSPAPFYPQALVLSADGNKLAALEIGETSTMYTSTNWGATWTSNSLPEDLWTSLASSADGSMLVAVGDFGPICVSTNSGATWTATDTQDYEAWTSVASSADGSKLAAVNSFGMIYTSANSGGSWTEATNLPAPVNSDQCSIACSADGTEVIATSSGQGIYTSTNSGATWMTTSAPPINWMSVASSADGSKLVAVTGGAVFEETGEGPIYSSTNGGSTWTSNSISGDDRWSIASSADGTVLMTGGNSGVYISQTTAAPQFNIAPTSGNLLLSWIVPSTNFVLQQNLDLNTTNWTPVTNACVLNLTNLENQVILAVPAGNTFYRLQTQYPEGHQ